MRPFWMAAAAVLVAATPVLAQHGHGQPAPKETMRQQPPPQPRAAPPPAKVLTPRGPDGMDACMAMMGGLAPGRALEQRDHLGLSGDQTRRLEQLREEVSTSAGPHMRLAMAAHMAAAAALEVENPDLAAYEAKLREMGDHALQGHVAMARASVRTREVLSPQQREILSKMRGEGHAGMMCPMMGDMHGGPSHSPSY